jgi:hypothetical protein
MIEGVNNDRVIEKGKKSRFPARFTILRFENVNVYRYIQLQGQENYDFTIFTNVTTLTALVILLSLTLNSSTLKP